MVSIMTPASMVGIWAATTTSPVAARQWTQAANAPWQPFEVAGPAIDESLHWFLVVRKQPDGGVTAFFRNPEVNAGAVIGTRALTLDGATVRLHAADRDDYIGTNSADGVAFAHLPFTNAPLQFHHATADDLRWYYPRSTAQWTYQIPAVLSDGWQTATLADAGMREAPLATLVGSIVANREPVLRSPYIQSISVARHGRLVLDEYFYGFNPDRPHDVRSAGKSVTTLMVGRAISDTKGFSPQSRVTALLPQYTRLANDGPRKQAITVANLMTMAPGFDCNDNDDKSLGNEGSMQDQSAQPDWYRYTLDLPMVSDPGTRSVYCTAGINLLGAIVANQSAQPLTKYFATTFAQPMQFGVYGMWLMPSPTNAAYMGGGDYFRPRDFLKFGQLFLDRGRWNGRQIVDEAWLRESVIARTEPEGEGDRYGYGWHLTTVNVRGKSYDVINAGGNGGQLLIIIPACDVTIMVTAGNYMQFPIWRQFLPEIASAAIEATFPE
jgi:CubicO group peptidase (beta-lactamase class C family)